ncbi:nucleoside phosphorylase [Jatrophihabitans fulvus]
MPIGPEFYSAVSRRPGPREHIACGEEDVGRYVLLPGDPARADAIAERLQDAVRVADHREYRTWTGTLDGVRVSVTSTGIGGPSTAIAVEELAQLGVHTVVRVGTCGALQPDVHVGDLVVATAAIRDEGTTHQYAPGAFPAVADVDVVGALSTAGTRRAGVHLGVVHTTDTYYGQHEPDRMPVASDLERRREAWTRLGALCSEMETATVLIVAGAVHRMRAGSVLAVAGNRFTGENLDSVAMRARRDGAVDAAVGTAIDALRTLIAADVGDPP